MVLACFLEKRPWLTVVELVLTSISPARAEIAFSVVRSAIPGSTSLWVKSVRNPSELGPHLARAGRGPEGRP